MFVEEHQPIPRYCQHIAFPPYTYVPGMFPHPFRSEEGHGFRLHPSPSRPPANGNWRECVHYRMGLDLFNHGYYWEAHELWEALWHAYGRRGAAACFLQGLIHLAAAGVKVRMGNERGMLRHGKRAAELMQTSLQLQSASCVLGAPVEEMIRFAQNIHSYVINRHLVQEKRVVRVFSYCIKPVREEE